MGLQRENCSRLAKKQVSRGQHQQPHKGDLHTAPQAPSQDPSQIASCFECFNTARNVDPDFIITLEQKQGSLSYELEMLLEWQALTEHGEQFSRRKQDPPPFLLTP